MNAQNTQDAVLDTKSLALKIGNNDMIANPKSNPESPDTFQIVSRDSEYIETGLSLLLGSDDQIKNDTSVFIVARGATGKSALAQYLSGEIGAPLWNTSIDKTIGYFSLRMHLADYLMHIRPDQSIEKMSNPTVIIDAVDEAQVRVSSQSWDEFKENVVKYAKHGLRFVVLGRENALWDIMASFEEESISHICYEILPFDELQQERFVDARYSENSTSPGSINSKSYTNVRDRLLRQVRELDAVGGDQGKFSGYAPVLEAISATIAGESNIAKFESDLNERQPPPAKSLSEIVDFILDREQVKFVSSLDMQDPGSEELFGAQEQIQCILHEKGLAPSVDVPPTVPEDNKDRYLDARSKQLSDHPFIAGGGSFDWASKVFEAYSIVQASDYVSPRKSLVDTGYKNPYVFIFWEDLVQSSCTEGGRVLDEWAISAIHASRVSAYDSRLSQRNTQAQALVSTNSWFTGEPLNANGAPCSNFEYVVGVGADGGHRSGGDRTTVFSFTTARSGELKLYGPLSYITVLSPSGVVRFNSMERSPFLGPNFGVISQRVLIDSSEVRLPIRWGTRDRVEHATPAAMLVVGGFDVPLPAVYGFDRQKSEQPVVHVIEESTLPFPWNLFRADAPSAHGGESWFPTLDKVYSLVAELRVLRAKAKRSSTGGMERTAWCARVGLPRDGESTNRILDILRSRGVVRVENELVVYTDDEDVRPFFATPFDPVFGASPQFLELPNDAQVRWHEVLSPIENELGGQR